MKHSISNRGIKAQSQSRGAPARPDHRSEHAAVRSSAGLTLALTLMVSACGQGASDSDGNTVQSATGPALQQQQPQFAFALNALQDGTPLPDPQLAQLLPQTPEDISGTPPEPDEIPVATPEPISAPLVLNPDDEKPLVEPTEQTAAPLITSVAELGEVFESYSTPGFSATVQSDNSALIRWDAMPGARGYNVYRAAEYIATVFTTEYLDTDINPSQSYYYRVEAFDFNDQFTRLADGLTLVGAQSRSVTQAPQSILNEYELVFNEEFRGSSLDASKWNTAYLWGDDLIINQEEQHYVDILNQPNFGYNPFVFNGETMTIRSIETPPELLGKANGQRYLSGVITSYDAFKFTYGYVETRARMPRGRGYWAAFWLLNAYYVERKPEIDIVEHIGHEQDRIYHTYHYYDSNDQLRSTNSLETAGVDYTSDFHTFGVEWKPGTLIYYVDGVEQHRITDPSISSQDMYIIANTAIGGWWPGSPDATTPFPGEYEIDYIRAYQKVGPSDPPPQFDLPAQIPLLDPTRFGSPNHRPSYEQWPEGYPDR